MAYVQTGGKLASLVRAVCGAVVSQVKKQDIVPIAERKGRSVCVSALQGNPSKIMTKSVGTPMGQPTRQESLLRRQRQHQAKAKHQQGGQTNNNKHGGLVDTTATTNQTTRRNKVVLTAKLLLLAANEKVEDERLLWCCPGPPEGPPKAPPLAASPVVTEPPALESWALRLAVSTVATGGDAELLR